MNGCKKLEHTSGSYWEWNGGQRVFCSAAMLSHRLNRSPGIYCEASKPEGLREHAAQLYNKDKGVEKLRWRQAGAGS